jgi:hypothetical protein
MEEIGHVWGEYFEGTSCSARCSPVRQSLMPRSELYEFLARPSATCAGTRRWKGRDSTREERAERNTGSTSAKIKNRSRKETWLSPQEGDDARHHPCLGRAADPDAAKGAKVALPTK